MENADKEVEALLFAVAESLDVREIIRLEVKYPVEEAVRKISGELALLSPAAGVAGGLINYIQVHDLSAQFSQGGRTLGINFKAKFVGDFYGCTLFYRPGPLPLAEVSTLYFKEFGSVDGWMEKLFSSKSVDAVQTRTDILRRSKYYGRGDNRYLVWKRGWLPWKSVPSKDALNAGAALREQCRRVWQHREEDFAQSFFTRLLPWSYTDFIKKFDKALIEEVGTQKMRELLEAMGTSVESWFGV